MKMVKSSFGLGFSTLLEEVVDSCLTFISISNVNTPVNT